jgi:hypothetical protein
MISVRNLALPAKIQKQQYGKKDLHCLDGALAVAGLVQGLFAGRLFLVQDLFTLSLQRGKGKNNNRQQAKTKKGNADRSGDKDQRIAARKQQGTGQVLFHRIFGILPPGSPLKH